MVLRLEVEVEEVLGVLEDYESCQKHSELLASQLMRLKWTPRLVKVELRMAAVVEGLAEERSLEF